MPEGTQKQLDGQSWLDFSSWLPALAVLFLLFGCLLALHTTVRKEREVSGVVKQATWRLNQDTGQRYSAIHVALSNNRIVRAIGFAPALPEVGARVKLRKRAMLLGYTTYRWDGPGSAARQRADDAAAASMLTPISAP